MHHPRSVLLSVSRPARYVGGEFNQPPLESSPDVTVCLAYPDTYEVGMSYPGLLILYHLLNETPGVRCERVFAPWPDMEKALRSRGLPLLSLESGTPLRRFDIVGFSLQHDLCFTNILTMLDLGGIPLRAEERKGNHPWVIGGGPCAMNPEPVSDFLDAFCIGDGEDAIVEITRTIAELRRRQKNRESVREALAEIEGVYVPALYDPVYAPNRMLAGFQSDRAKVRRRIVDPETAFYPARPIVPHLTPIHDRCTLEARRGCARGCRFCQAGYTTRPVRERLPRTLRAQAETILSATGDDEIGLLALSIGDYSEIDRLTSELAERFGPSGVSLTLPSLRVDGFRSPLAEKAARVRRSSLTFAPEVGTEKMRRVVNKPLDRDDVLAAIEATSAAGFDLTKLYFMVGLPLEEMEDVNGIADLVNEIRRSPGKERKRLNVSVAGFVPKPHTPFQWCAQLPPGDLEARMHHLRDRMRRKGITMHYHDPRQSFLEAVFSRGDRRLGGVVERAYASGCRFDQWSETFDFDLWLEAFREKGLSPDFYALREREKDEVFPWDPIDVGVTREFLWAEWERAQACATTADCTLGKCAACGVCDGGQAHLLAAAGRWQRAEVVETKKVTTREVEKSTQDTERDEDHITRIRLEYSRKGPLDLIGHLDFQRGIQKLFRRAEIPVVFTKGYNPRPRISFALPLPLGEEAEADLLDAELERERIDTQAILSTLNEVAQPGLRFTSARIVERTEPKITALPRAVRYRVDVGDTAGSPSPKTRQDLEARWERVLAHERLLVKRRGKGDKGDRDVDLRPFLSSFKAEVEEDGPVGLRFEFALIDARTARTHEVLAAMFEGENPEVLRVVREGIILRQC